VPTPTSLLKTIGRWPAPFRSDRLKPYVAAETHRIADFRKRSVVVRSPTPPQEILLILTLGGLAYLYLTPLIAAAVVLLLAVVVLSYRQVVQAYPSGGRLV